MGAITWIGENWVNLVAAVGATVTGFSLIAKLTPWESDDKVADFLIQCIHFLAIQKKQE